MRHLLKRMIEVMTRSSHSIKGSQRYRLSGDAQAGMFELKLHTSTANGPDVRLSENSPCAISNKCRNVAVP